MNDKKIQITPNLEMSDRELKLVNDALNYGEDPYGSPGHLYLLTIGKLFSLLPMYEQSKILQAISSVREP